MKVNYSKYNHFFMSAMKGIKKDPKALRKITKAFFKINIKKISHYISGHTFQFPVLAVSLLRL